MHTRLMVTYHQQTLIALVKQVTGGFNEEIELETSADFKNRLYLTIIL